MAKSPQKELMGNKKATDETVARIEIAFRR